MATRMVTAMFFALASCGPVSQADDSGGGSGDDSQDDADSGESIGASGNDAQRLCEEVSACVVAECSLEDYWLDGVDDYLSNDDYRDVLACTVGCGATDHYSQTRALFDAWDVAACEEPSAERVGEPNARPTCEQVSACVREHVPLERFVTGPDHLSDPDWYFANEVAGLCGAGNDEDRKHAVWEAWGFPPELGC